MKSFERLSGPCTRHAHELLERPSQHCFSKRPVTECGPTCRPSSVSTKSIEFVCMSKGRLSERYAAKVRNGEAVPELENQSVAFSTTMKLPRTCQPVA